MKNNHILVFMFSLIVFSASALAKTNVTEQSAKSVTVQGTFDGYDADSGYAFIIKDAEDDSDEYIFFEDITSEALKTINLQSDALIGKRFEITYEITEYEEEDENGNPETFEKFTIVKLKQL